MHNNKQYNNACRVVQLLFTFRFFCFLILLSFWFSFFRAVILAGRTEHQESTQNTVNLGRKMGVHNYYNIITIKQTGEELHVDNWQWEFCIALSNLVTHFYFIFGYCDTPASVFYMPRHYCSARSCTDGSERQTKMPHFWPLAFFLQKIYAEKHFRNEILKLVNKYWCM